jgi:hypothetical protein
MRIERRKLGVRVRVILNRTEAREAGLTALQKSGKLKDKDHPSPRTAQVYIGGIGRGAGDYHVDPATFERECRIIAARQIDVPIEASFRVGLDDEGQVAGATFQFFDLNNDIS